MAAYALRQPGHIQALTPYQGYPSTQTYYQLASSPTQFQYRYSGPSQNTAPQDTYLPDSSLPHNLTFQAFTLLKSASLRASAIGISDRTFSMRCFTRIPHAAVPPRFCHVRNAVAGQLQRRRDHLRTRAEPSDQDPYESLFKSAVFKSDLVRQEFNRYACQCPCAL